MSNVIACFILCLMFWENVMEFLDDLFCFFRDKSGGSYENSLKYIEWDTRFYRI